MSNEKNIMAASAPVILGQRKIPGFDPLKFAKERSDQAGKKTLTLDLEHKKNWFRLACPNGGLVLNALRVTDTMAIYEARVFANQDDRNPLASFTASKAAGKATAGQQYIREAQDDALNVALDNAGFDIQLFQLALTVEAAKQTELATQPATSDVNTEQPPEPAAESDPPPVSPKPPTSEAPRPAPVDLQPHSADIQASSEKKNASPAAVVDISTRRPMPQEAHEEPAKKQFQHVTEISAKPVEGNGESQVDTTPMAKPANTNGETPESMACSANPAKVNKEAQVDTAPSAESAEANGETQVGMTLPSEPAEANNESQVGTTSEIQENTPVTYTADMAVDEICKCMTLEQALALKVSSGICAGWTLEQVAKDRPTALKYYQFACPFSDNILKAASKLVMANLEQKMAG